MRYHIVRSRPHLSAAIAVGALAGVFLPSHWKPLVRVLSAWDISVWMYLFTVGWMMMRADHREVKRIAARQDERAATILASLVIATVASMIAISSELASLRDMPANERGLHYAFVVMTLVGSWFLVGTLFCFHYAHLYYKAEAPAPPVIPWRRDPARLLGFPVFLLHDCRRRADFGRVGASTRHAQTGAGPVCAELLLQSSYPGFICEYGGFADVGV